MTTLVERLRAGPDLNYDASERYVTYGVSEVDKLLEEAADRIEQLENAMKQIQGTIYGAAS